jgi:integrase
MGLTQKRIAKLNGPGRYSDGHQLYLQVQSPTNKSWLFRYTFDGRERFMGLGPLHTIDLEEARERARLARKTLLDGADPLAVRAAEAAQRALEAARTITFEAAAKTYYEGREASWKNAKHRQQFWNTLKAYVFPKIGKLPVADIDTGLVLKCIEPIWQDKTETANRVRGRIESVLDWATVRGYRKGDNPARWRGHLSEVLPARGKIQRTNHHAALSFIDIPEFMAALRHREGIAARALEFSVLTAARTGEVIGATWNEINFKEKVWTVPDGRIKGGREHRVPLSSRALEILSELPTEKGNRFIFIGTRNSGLSNMAMSTLLARMGRDVTVHGFRSTFRDWCAERTNYPNHVVEMALAHVIGDKVEAAYRRGDLFAKRVRLMRDWARYCITKPMEATAANVVPLQRGRH